MEQKMVTSRFLNQSEKPQFRTLDELKVIFKSSSDIPDELLQLDTWAPMNVKYNMFIRINIDKESFVDFRIKQLDLMTFLMIQSAEAYDMLNKGRVEMLIETLSKNRKSKAHIVLLNVLKPILDIELVASLPEDVLDCLFFAHISDLNENKSTVEQILRLPEDRLYEVGRMGITGKTRPSDMFIPGVTCTLTKWAIDNSIFKIVWRREGREIP